MIATSLVMMWKLEPQEGTFHYVTKSIYSSGKNNSQQKKARSFLEEIGVCEVDEAERIKMQF